MNSARYRKTSVLKYPKTLKVLGISASPRIGGNSDLLLDKALEGSRSQGAVAEKIILNSLNIRPCQACGGCDKTGVCIIPDDMCIIYDKIDGADAVILSSPVYFTSLSAQMKAMIDRYQCRWVRKHLLKKKAGSMKKGTFLCVSAAGKLSFFERCEGVVKALFNTIDVTYCNHIYLGHLNRKAEVLSDNNSLERAFRLGASLVKDRKRR